MANLSLYTYVRHLDEHELCRLEMRAFFGYDVDHNVLFSEQQIDPDRSPFFKERLDIIVQTTNFEQLLNQVEQLPASEEPFKVICLNTISLNDEARKSHSERRQLERQIGLVLKGEPSLTAPSTLYGFVQLHGKWYFGKLHVSKPIWSDHIKKPHMYSTALSTRVARALANIAVPFPKNVRAIDPCCGIGTVVVEARSMGIQIDGRDINPIVCHGARKNLAYFGLHSDIVKGPINEVADTYDVAIIDLPYNLYTHITTSGQRDILTHGKRIAKKVVIVTIEPIDAMLHDIGLTIIDRCIAKKSTFHREILVCTSS